MHFSVLKIDMILAAASVYFYPNANALTTYNVFKPLNNYEILSIVFSAT